MSPQKVNLFDVFALPSASVTKLNTPGVDENGQPIRLRRKHIKSRAGCTTCKERRVKCDEKRPVCTNCTNRNVNCHFDKAPELEALKTSRSRPARLPTPPGQYGAESSSADDSEAITGSSEAHRSTLTNITKPSIDLESMKLMHHFETSTAKTLVFGSELWQHKVMQLALQHDYLMHAFLLISAAHLRYLRPNSIEFVEAEAHHLALTLSGFRVALSEELSPENTDPIIACSIILLHHSWSVPYSSGVEAEEDIGVDIGADNLLSFSAGLKTILISTWDRREKSMFKDLLDPEQVKNFKEWASTATSSYSFEDRFLHRPKFAQGEDDDDSPEACVGMGCGSLDAVDRLIPFLYAIDNMSRGVDLDYLLPEVNQYLLMWPSKCTNDFQREVKENDNEALLVMLCFYCSTLHLMSKDVWWIRERSDFMCKIIAERLGQSGNNCEGRVTEICRYFDFKWDPQSEIGDSFYV